MDIYRALKFVAGGVVPGRVKLLGLACLVAAGRRYLGVFIDPVLGCNLRCRMCYFSDEGKRASMHGVMTEKQIDAAAKSLFHRALKLQIGCGAEPTLYPGLESLIRRGKECGVPYVSLTTNGQLIGSGRVDLEALVVAGLDELTLSLHGTDRATYEYLMPGARFENLISLISKIKSVRETYPDFRLRVNFTINSRNVENLYAENFWPLWDGVRIDVLQLRPVQNLGESAWRDFDLEPLKARYAQTVGALVEECKARGTRCLAPSFGQLDMVDDEQDWISGVIEDVTYCYVSPAACYKEDFRPGDETVEAYNRRTGLAGQLLRRVFRRGRGRRRDVSKKLNYRVE